MRRFIRSLIMALALSPLAALALEPVNVNTADAVALQQVKGIGATKAKAIIDYRNANGPFASIDDLVKVPGIGAKSLEQLKPQVTVSTGSKASSTKPSAAGKS
ncbi:competence protein ComE [Betaproteobacteria bacterium]|nr:competence protein ComE [Betaproteobacteria bacterium]GHU02837.1 competence protein ComE [Betaproteobacteria bacterium]GHU05192.1 competence protein ComE [Betaproteobacteria bacterium]GHU23541.1 competence protein ComE [Betaproteobacteria bacterium]GHU24818.1 competence protein ComE [Betaproteobacteria bacterium]